MHAVKQTGQAWAPSLDRRACTRSRTLGILVNAAPTSQVKAANTPANACLPREPGASRMTVLMSAKLLIQSCANVYSRSAKKGPRTDGKAQPVMSMPILRPSSSRGLSEATTPVMRVIQPPCMAPKNNNPTTTPPAPTGGTQRPNRAIPAPKPSDRNTGQSPK